MLNVILDCLLKWFAPILSFTTEEIFRLINQNKKEASIHLKRFNEIPKNWYNKNLEDKWRKIIRIRNHANSSIETKRAEKLIGSSLEATISIELNNEIFQIVKDYDFSEICITSNAELKNNNSMETDIRINTSKAEGDKCPKCWKIIKNKCKRCS